MSFDRLAGTTACIGGTGGREGGVCGALIIACTALLLAGCPSRAPQTSGPEEVLRTYAQAIQAGEHKRAYQMMSPAYRERVDQQTFISSIRKNPAEMQFILGQLSNKAQQVTISAALDVGSQERLLLVNTSGHWSIATDPMAFYPQQTPAQAIRSFVRAIENKRYDVLLRFVPAQRAKNLSEAHLKKYFEGSERDEAQSLVRAIKANLSSPIHIAGETANMPYGERNVVKFLLEDGVWKIETPH